MAEDFDIQDLLLPFTEQEGSDAAAGELIDGRVVTPWLRSTQWHEYTRGRNPKKLQKLVAMPNEDEFPGIRTAVSAYFDKCTERIIDLPLLVRQKLNTQDPIDGLVSFIGHALDNS